MRHPFERWPPVNRRRILLALVAAAIAMQVLLALLDAPLRETGDGTIDLELAGNAERAEEIVAGWRSENVLENATFIDGLDFLFAPLYAGAIAGVCVAAAGAWRRRGKDGVANLGIGIAWAASAAVAFDWIENVALAAVLLDEPVSPWPAIALASAIPKFAGTWSGLLFALSGVAALLLRRPRPTPL